MSSDAESVPRGATGLLRDPAFAVLFWGKMFSGVGVWAQNLIAAVLAYHATGAATVVGAVSAVQFLPQLVLSPLSGVWADRYGAARQIFAGRLLCVAGSGGLALWLAVVGTRAGAAGAAPLIIASAVIGLGFVLGAPALQSIIPALVTPDELRTAAALNTFPLTVGRCAGPACGALIIATMSPQLGLAIATVPHALFAVGVRLARFPPQPPASRSGDRAFVAALRHVRADRPVRLALIGVAALAFGAEPAVTLAPSLADQIGGVSAVAGWLACSFGAGSALGVFAVIGFRRRIGEASQGTAGLLVMATALVTASAARSVPVGLLSTAVLGLGMAIALTAFSAIVQERAPAALRGRIMALWFIAFSGLRPLAAAFDGLVADHVSVEAGLLATAVLMATVGVAVRPARVRASVPAPAMDLDGPPI